MLRRAFVSTAIYALGRELGVARADAEFKRQLEQPDGQSLPVVRTIHRIRRLGVDVGLDLHAGCTVIAQMRSRAFYRAFQRDEFPCWLSVDDDIEVSTEACARMLDVLDDINPRIVLTPYLMRTTAPGDAQLSVSLPKIRLTRYLPADHLLQGPHFVGEVGKTRLVQLPTGYGGGFGFVGMNREAMRCIAAAHVDNATIRWRDEQDDGAEKLALFHDLIEEGHWFSEDVSFFRRVPPEVTVEILLSGNIGHAGTKLDLGAL